ncbi:hypothetical protein Gogos_009991, partial [Gossypium gossypioides]|nr:hypothetical protein [Gossypium gossypioides]
ELPFSIPYHCSPIPLPLSHHPLDLRCQKDPERTAKIEESNIAVGVGLEDVGGSSSEILVDGKLFSDLPGLQPNLWEGPKWDVLGFLVQ